MEDNLSNIQILHKMKLSASSLCLPSILLLAASSTAQVHYFPNGSPWNQQANTGPDAVVPGWYYNLGITGLRIELVENAPKTMVVRYVFPGSPADGKIAVGESIVGVSGASFIEAHENGYGESVFGARGPVGEFAVALEAAQSTAGGGNLSVRVDAGGAVRDEVLVIGQEYGAFSPTFPENCPKSELILQELLDFLVVEQKPNGSWGNPVNDLYANLALLAAGEGLQHDLALKNGLAFLASTTSTTDSSSLPNWKYMTAAIVLSEYYLLTGEAWVLPELTEVRDFLMAGQYTMHSQVDPNAQVTHPGTFPDDYLDSHGGWGHNPGFEGYGPIGMLTGQGALALSLMKRCGLEISREHHDFAYAFLARGTGQNGYVWYKDVVAGPTNWADQGRTSASALANRLAPYPQTRYRRRAFHHLAMIQQHPESFPDTHGSPQLGMGLAAAASSFKAQCFRSLMDANRWWFALAQCGDKTYYYQPNRDNAMYGSDSRVSASAVTAFMFSIPRGSLVISGRL